MLKNWSGLGTVVHTAAHYLWMHVVAYYWHHPLHHRLYTVTSFYVTDVWFSILGGCIRVDWLMSLSLIARKTRKTGIWKFLFLLQNTRFVLLGRDFLNQWFREAVSHVCRCFLLLHVDWGREEGERDLLPTSSGMGPGMLSNFLKGTEQLTLTEQSFCFIWLFCHFFICFDYTSHYFVRNDTYEEDVMGSLLTRKNIQRRQ